MQEIGGGGLRVRREGCPGMGLHTHTHNTTYKGAKVSGYFRARAAKSW